jgi:hypothetical protein
MPQGGRKGRISRNGFCLCISCSQQHRYPIFRAQMSPDSAVQRPMGSNLSGAPSQGFGGSTLARRANSSLASARTSATRAASHPMANQAAGSSLARA